MAGAHVQIIERNNSGGGLPAMLGEAGRAGGSLADWIEAYFRFEVSTAASSRAVQKRDLERFLRFICLEEGSDAPARWTHRLSRAFIDALRAEVNGQGRRRYADRTIARITAHLKTFAKWVHRLQPFSLGDPMAKIRANVPGTGLETERALTLSDKRRLLDAADCLPVIGGRSRDRHRYASRLPDARPRRKAYRPWRNRAIVALLIGTGMRRGAVVALELDDLDPERRRLTVREKGGHLHRYQASSTAIAAIQDYLAHERPADAAAFVTSRALFLPAASCRQSRGRLRPAAVNQIWNEVAALAGVHGKTPHAARHAMGRHIIQKTGNVAAVQRQLGHKNAAYSLQYARITADELQEIVDQA